MLPTVAFPASKGRREPGAVQRLLYRRGKEVASPVRDERAQPIARSHHCDASRFGGGGGGNKGLGGGPSGREEREELTSSACKQINPERRRRVLLARGGGRGRRGLGGCACENPAPCLSSAPQWVSAFGAASAPSEDASARCLGSPASRLSASIFLL